ncbi:MAG: glycosyltransferase [Gemmatimonadetes bacterium]|nr:glycosyltransferase [Gemmatimonadota bacterium]
MTLLPVLLALPWLGLIFFEAWWARFPSELPPAAGREPGSRSEEGATRDGATLAHSDPDLPSVSVVVPARNEAPNIVACVSSIAGSAYVDFEIIVVDDRSDDGTGDLARSVPTGNARRVVVLDGEALPGGWLGKPWACHQGSEVATGDLLLFTDADTVHRPDLVGRAVAGLRQERADLLTVLGRQIMATFWEWVVQPHVFFLMLLRFPDFERVAKNDNWRDAIANGQFLLFPRSSYDAIGGHTSVQDEVVEDLVLAQVVKRAGLRLRIRSAEDSLATRMYRSLGHLVEGWSKNMFMGGLQSVPRQLRWVLPPISFLGGIALWLAAPGVLLLEVGHQVVSAMMGAVSATGPATIMAAAPMISPPLLLWAVLVYALTLVMWFRWYGRMRAPRLYAFLYPLGAVVFAFIFLRSWMRGRDVEWKGRRYHLRSVSERA